MGKAILGLTALAIAIVAWVTHVVTCITAQAWILLAIGGFIVPVGVVHGFMLMLGHGLV